MTGDLCWWGTNRDDALKRIADVHGDDALAQLLDGLHHVVADTEEVAGIVVNTPSWHIYGLQSTQRARSIIDGLVHVGLDANEHTKLLSMGRELANGRMHGPFSFRIIALAAIAGID